MKLRSKARITLIVSSVFAAFALSLMLINLWMIRNISARTSDANASSLSYILRPLPDMFDDAYMTTIDDPMEEALTSTPFVSYAFTTPRYPAGQPLADRISADLEGLTNRSRAILGAFVYTASNDSFIASPSLYGANSPFQDCNANIREIIYNYNAGTMGSSLLSSDRHLTFFAKYRDICLISKDLTPSSGLMSSALFAVLDMKQFASSVYESRTLTPYARAGIQMAVYDGSGTPLYGSEGLDPLTGGEVLSHTLEDASVFKTDGGYGTSYRSDAVNCSYVIVVGRGFLSPFSQSIRLKDLVIANIIATALLISLLLMLFRGLLKPSEQQLAVLSSRLGLREGLSIWERPNVFAHINSAVRQSMEENEEMKSIISDVSADAMTMLFFRMLSGGQIDTRTLESALRYTTCGFGIRDIYVAGAVAFRNCNASDVARRYALNTALNEVLERHQQKYGYNGIVITLDAPYHAIILSFPPGTSIAKGRQAVNAIEPAFHTALSHMGETAFVAFGHLYHSIHDLPFSFHEALEIVTASGRTEVIRPAIEPAGQAAEAPDAAATPGGEPVREDSDFGALIDRRGAQIAQLVFDGNQASIEQVLNRTMDAIARQTDSARWPEYAQRLVNRVTESIMSHAFAVPDQLTDVSRSLTEAIQAGLEGQALLNETRRGVLVLCEDSRRILERQNSPYITAALEYIEANYMNPDLSLEEIAEGMKIAPNYLSSLFSKTLAKSCSSTSTRSA